MDIGDVDIESGRDIQGVRSPFGMVNEHTTTCGWPCSQVSLVYALKKAGKTSLLLQAAIDAADSGMRVLFATYEMSASQLKRRIYKMLTGSHVRPSTIFEAEEWERKVGAVKLWELEIFDPTGSDRGFEVETLYDRCVEMAAGSRGLDLVCVDFAQKMRSNQKLTNRTAELEHVSWSLATLARRMPTTALLVGSQVTMVEGEAYAKGCRQLEEDCGIALLLSRNKENDVRAQITYNRFGKSWVEMPVRWNERTLTLDEG